MLSLKLAPDLVPIYMFYFFLQPNLNPKQELFYSVVLENVAPMRVFFFLLVKI